MLRGVRYRLVGGNEMPPGYKIQWGQISSRIDEMSGTKAQDATLYNEKGKAVAWYYAASDEVVFWTEMMYPGLIKRMVEKLDKEELIELLNDISE